MPLLNPEKAGKTCSLRVNRRFLCQPLFACRYMFGFLSSSLSAKSYNAFMSPTPSCIACPDLSGSRCVAKALTYLDTRR